MDRMEKVLNSKTLSAIHKKFGKESIVCASSQKAKSIHRYPTNIFQLDYALGGGFPVGRISVVHGPKSSGKTTLVLKTIASAQEHCSLCYTKCGPPDGECECKKFRDVITAFIDVEGTWDPEWAMANWVDINRVLISQPDTAEEALDILEGLVRSGDVDIIALDSLAFLTPSREIEDSSAKDQPGLQPRLIGKGMRKLVSAMNSMERRPTVLFTNQIRYKVGVMFGSPEVQPGGMAPGFASSLELKVWPGKTCLDDVTGKPYHIDMKFRVTKNKTAPPNMEGEYRIILSDTDTKKASDSYDESFIVNMSEKIGLVDHAGKGKWVCLGREFKRKDLVEEAILEDREFYNELRTALSLALSNKKL